MDKEKLFNLKIDTDIDPMKAQIKKNWDRVAKPLDGLGLLEDMICDVGAAQGSDKPEISPRALVIMCADNGIVAEGVSQSGQEVTLAVAKNMSAGQSSACRMAQECNTDVYPVDIGINCDSKEVPEKVLARKVIAGTRNFAAEPAMTQDECLQAIAVGIEIADELAKKGYKILATGEMGIGNTTTSTAVACALLNLDPAEVAGRGAGLDDAGLSRKINVVRQALNKYGYSDHASDMSADSTLEVLRTLGGLDIAGLCGVFIGGALNHMPVVLDGLISSVAALCANRILPGTNKYMLASHCGKEPAMKYLLEELDLEAPVRARLSLGEGTGALMIFPMLDMALKVYGTSGSFDDIGVKQYERYI